MEEGERERRIERLKGGEDVDEDDHQQKIGHKISQEIHGDQDEFRRRGAQISAQTQQANSKKEALLQKLAQIDQSIAKNKSQKDALKPKK